MEQLAAGSAHGRFQPFHNGHLDYVLQALARAKHVYIGITQIIRPPTISSSGRHRDTSEANPLSYFERGEIITATLLSEGVEQRRFSITPFPIEQPAVLHQFQPTSITCFTTRLNEWNDEKITRLRGLGYDVELLNVAQPDGVTIAAGSEIRRLIREGSPDWKAFVPAGAARLIEDQYIDRF